MRGSLSNVTNFQDSVSTSAVNSKPVHSQRLSAKPFVMKCSMTMYSPFVQAFWHKKNVQLMPKWTTDAALRVDCPNYICFFIGHKQEITGFWQWGDWECGMRVLLESACILKDKHD